MTNSVRVIFASFQPEVQSFGALAQKYQSTCSVRHNEKDECALRSCKENSLPQCLRCCGERTTNTGPTKTGTGKVRGDYGTGIEVVQARAPLQLTSTSKVRENYGTEVVQER